MIKRLSLLWLFLIVSIALSSNVSITITVSGEDNQATQTIQDFDLKVTFGSDGNAAFKCPDASYINLPGEPRIPWKIITVLLPEDTDTFKISASLVNCRYEPVKGKWTVGATEAMRTFKDGVEIIAWPETKNLINGKDEDIYAQDAFWPNVEVRFLDTGQLDQYKLARFAIPLARYNPQISKIMLLEQAELHIEFKEVQLLKTKSRLPERIRDASKKRLKNLTENYDSYIDSYSLASDDNASGFMEIQSDGNEPNAGYVIITTSNIQSNSTKLADFISHKESMGFNVQVITESQFGGGVGNTAADNIRSWLQANYISENIEYVLLIGNPDPNIGEVPMKRLWPRYGAVDGVEQAPSDYYYADLTGNWDLDGDGYFGEWDGDFGTGGIDLYYEVMVGRIPCYGDVNELDAILQKTINYEQVYGESEQWRKNVLIPSNRLTTSIPGWRFGEQIKYSICEAQRWLSHRIYDEDYDLFPPPETTPCDYNNVLSVWTGINPDSNGMFGLVVWSTHGSSTVAGDVMTSANTAQLDNNHPSFVFQVSCNNAYPEVNNNLSYSLLKNGGICMVGATRESWISISQQLYNPQGADNIAFEYSHGLVRTKLTGGESFHYLRQIYTPMTSEGWMNFLVFNIYGDPSLQIIRAEPEPHVPVTYHVDILNGTEEANGLNWENAFRDLQDVFDVAWNNDTILVAEGVYTPTEPNGNRGQTFRPPYGVSIYGGFPVGGGTWEQRDSNVYKTILSGDLNGNDVGGAYDPSREENSYHVITCTSDFLLDGFTIASGHANSNYPNYSGGGMLISHSNAKLKDCIFRNNYASIGGAIESIYYCSIEFEDCNFTGNVVGAGSGAAFRGREFNGDFTDCFFALNSGGSVVSIDVVGNISLKNCIFLQNQGGQRGGAISGRWISMALENCLFQENSSKIGGAIYLSESNLDAENCVFSGNSAYGPTSDDGGGAIYNWEVFLTLRNCLFCDNIAPFGGAINIFHSNNSLENCTIADNVSSDLGSAMYIGGGSSVVTIKNSIVWHNQFYKPSPVTQLNIVYSCIENGFNGIGNISQNPLFTDPCNNDYHLKSENGRWDPDALMWIYDLVTSPCIDTGDPNSEWSLELWPHGKRVNMGVYGNTAQASMSSSPFGNCADLNNNGTVDMTDFSIFADDWQLNEILLASDIDRDGDVDIYDLEQYALNWLSD